MQSRACRQGIAGSGPTLQTCLTLSLQSWSSLYIKLYCKNTQYEYPSLPKNETCFYLGQRQKEEEKQKDRKENTTLLVKWLIKKGKVTGK